jgi:hypothetical protein
MRRATRAGAAARTPAGLVLYLYPDTQAIAAITPDSDDHTHDPARDGVRDGERTTTR